MEEVENVEHAMFYKIRGADNLTAHGTEEGLLREFRESLQIRRVALTLSSRPTLV